MGVACLAVGEFPTPEEIWAEDQVNWNEDWIKTLHWDLPKDFERLGQAIGIGDGMNAAQRAEVWERFLHLPASVPMPDDLRAKAQAAVRDGRTAATGRLDMSVDTRSF